MEVVQIKCDRCTRVELVPPSQETEEPDFEARIGDKKLVYEDLCSRCKVALNNIWDDLGKWDRDLNQPFGPTVPTERAAPSQPAPDYTPPKPHSQAAGKK